MKTQTRTRNTPPKQRSPRKAARQAEPPNRHTVARFSARARGVDGKTIELGVYRHDEAVAAAAAYWKHEHVEAWVWDLRTGETVYHVEVVVQGGAR